MASTVDMPIPSNYNPTGINPGDPNNEISRLKDLQSFVPGADNNQVKVLGLQNTPSPFVSNVVAPIRITPSLADPVTGGNGGIGRDFSGRGRAVNVPVANLTVPLNPQGNGGIGVGGAGGYAPGLSKPGVPVATGRDYGVPVTVAAMSGQGGGGDPRLHGMQYWRDLGIDPTATDGSMDYPLKWLHRGAANPAGVPSNGILPGESLGIPTNLAPNKTAPVSVSNNNMSATAQAVMGVNSSPSASAAAPASGVHQTAIPGAGAGTPAPIAGPTNIYGYPTSGPTSGNGTYTGPTVGGGLDPALHDELVKTYGDGFGNTLWNTLKSGAGFNPQIANAFIKEMQPIFQENLANAMEYFSGTGSRFSSAAALGAGKAVADFSAKQQAVFAQMYMWAYQNYLNVLQYGATNTGDNTFGNIRSILGLIGTAGKAIQGGNFGGTAGTIGDVLAGL